MYLIEQRPWPFRWAPHELSASSISHSDFSRASYRSGPCPRHGRFVEKYGGGDQDVGRHPTGAKGTRCYWGQSGSQVQVSD